MKLGFCCRRTTCSFFFLQTTCSINVLFADKQNNDRSWSFGQRLKKWFHSSPPKANQSHTINFYTPIPVRDGNQQTKTQARFNYIVFFPFFSFGERKCILDIQLEMVGHAWVDRCTRNKGRGEQSMQNELWQGGEMRGAEKQTQRKCTATAQGCKHCKIEAYGDARWCIVRKTNPGHRREIQPRDSRETAWCERWRWITSDFPERWLHATAFFWELEKKKKNVHSYKHSFHHFVPGCQRILQSLHFFFTVSQA